MFYTFIFKLVRFLTLILNGRTKVVGKENLPTDEKFVLVAPHRTYLDPVYIAVTSYPFRFSFMAKQELFKIPVLNWIIRHLNAFPVDRENQELVQLNTVNYLKMTN